MAARVWRLESSCLPTTTFLAKFNSHPTDGDLVFIEEGHRYLYKGVVVPLSITSIGKSDDDLFVSDDVITKCYAGWKHGSGIYHDIIVRCGCREDAVAEIKALWATASVYGTLLHETIEFACNSCDWKYYEFSIPPEIAAEYKLWQGWTRSPFVTDVGLAPYRTEWPLALVVNDVAIVAGMPDCVFVDRSGLYYLLDWKRVVPTKSLAPGTADHTKFSNQLSNYANLLKLYVGIDVGDRLYVVRMYAGLENAEVVKCTDLRDETGEVLDDLVIDTIIASV